MTALTHELKASYAFIERNFFLSRRYWGWEIAFLVYSAAGALAISFIGSAGRRYPPDADPHRRRDLLELPVGGVQLDRGDDPDRALGGHARVHVHGPGPAVDPPARRRGLRHGVRADPHGRDRRGHGPVLPGPFDGAGELRPRSAGSCSSARSAWSASRCWPRSCRSCSWSAGMQMAFVLQSVLLLVSGVYYSIDVLPGLDAGRSRGSRRPRTPSTACGPGSSTASRCPPSSATSGRCS